METVERVKELAGPYLAEHDIELVDIVFRSESQGMVLRLLVDTPRGISLGECGTLNRFLGERLDAENAIEGSYVLEVSSPGIDRPLVTKRDFERVTGKPVEIMVLEPVLDRKSHEGVLADVSQDTVVIENKNGKIAIPIPKIVRARQKIDI